MGLDALNTNNDVSCVSCHCHIESILLGTHKTRVGGFVQQQVKRRQCSTKTCKRQGSLSCQRRAVGGMESNNINIRFLVQGAALLLVVQHCYKSTTLTAFDCGNQTFKANPHTSYFLDKKIEDQNLQSFCRSTSSGTATHFSLHYCVEDFMCIYRSVLSK